VHEDAARLNKGLEIRRANAAPSAGVHWDSFPSTGWLRQISANRLYFSDMEELPDEKAKADQHS
jgi:hypothetical protein